jgi:hypothetical protein
MNEGWVNRHNSPFEALPKKRHSLVHQSLPTYRKIRLYSFDGMTCLIGYKGRGAYDLSGTFDGKAENALIGHLMPLTDPLVLWFRSSRFTAFFLYCAAIGLVAWLFTGPGLWPPYITVAVVTSLVLALILFSAHGARADARWISRLLQKI